MAYKSKILVTCVVFILVCIISKVIGINKGKEICLPNEDYIRGQR